MREYARVYPAFWTGKTGKQIRQLGIKCQLAAVYVISSPHANMIGLYHLPLPYIVYDTGLMEDDVLDCLHRLSTLSFCFYDTDTEFVWIPEMARFQIGSALKPIDNQAKGAQNLYKIIPDNPFLYEFYKLYKDDFHIVAPRFPSEQTAAISDTPLKGDEDPFQGG